jgi:hypothetical protein
MATAKKKGKNLGYGAMPAVPSDRIGVRGFCRLQIVEERKGRKKPVVVGDSGWFENQIVIAGFENGICACVGGVAGSSQVTYAALGTGTQPASNGTTLQGEITDVAGARCSVTPTTIATKTVQFAFTLASGVYTTTHSIQNVGLFQTSTTAGGTLYAGQTYASSQLQSNQAVNASYQWQFT